MKKLLCVFVCILLFAGCEKISKKVENEIPDFYGFRTNVKTKINDITITGTVEYTELDGVVLLVTEPVSVKGMKISIKDDECVIEDHSLSFFVPLDSMPPDSICVCLNACANSVKTSIKENDYYVYSYKENTYHLYVDSETKKFKKITMNENKIISFENFQFLAGQTD